MLKKTAKQSLFAAFLCLLSTSHAQVVISEFLAVNSNGIEAENGNRYDWIELHNTSTQPVNLSGWYLTDNAQDLTKWEISPVEIPGGGYHVFWASNNNKKDPDEELHTNFKLSGGGEFLALVNPDGTTIEFGFDPVFPPQVDDVSYGYTAFNPLSTPKYFNVPTPGTSNVGGSENIGPYFSEQSHLPAEPLESENLVVTVKASDMDGIASIKMYWRIMHRATKNKNTIMVDDGLHGDGAAGDGVYGAIIPASEFSSGELIRYRFEATDGSGHSSKWPLHYDPDFSAEYFGTISHINITSTLPVYHWFDSQPDKTGASGDQRCSLYYDGKLYDNVMRRVRGKSTYSQTGVLRKSYKFDFNRGDHFDFDPAFSKAEEINLNTTYGDKTYLRRMLAWKSYEKAGQVGSHTFLVRLRQNNEFFGVQAFEEQVDSDYLKRHDYDTEGAMWKVANFEGNHFSHNGHIVEKKNRKEDPFLTDQDAPVHDLIDHITQYDTSHIIDNMDMANVINYLALTTLMHDFDAAAKNHYYYQDTDGTGEWSIFPWDKDLIYGSYWDVNAPSGQAFLHDDLQLPTGLSAYPTVSYMQRAVNASPMLKAMYYCRMRSVLDLLVEDNPTNPCWSEQLLIDHLDAYETDLQVDKGQWGDPWVFGANLSPREANTQFTIDGYLNPARTFFYSHPDLPTVQPETISIQISKAEVIPSSGNQLEEYIELHNTNSYAVDLSGWSLSNAVDHVFDAGSVILPGGYYYVSPDSGAFRNRSASPKRGEMLFVQDAYKGMLSSRGETLALHNADGTLIDSETWAADLSAAQQWLRITEVMFNPDPPSGTTEDHLEFVELKNIGSVPLDIGGTYFSQGLIFTNPDITIPAGEFVVIASDPVAFAAQYNTNGISVLGPFYGYLGNGNDTIELEDHRGETIQRFEYNDDWYPNTDGDGFSLTLLNPSNPDLESWNTNAAWSASINMGGSPGTADSGLPAGSVIINEILAHSDTGGDWIELKNTTASPIDISYWFLSDDKGNPKKYRFPASTELPANGFIVITESQLGTFALSELGDEVILTMANSNDVLQGYQVIRDFDATAKDVSLGYWYDSEGDKQFIPMAGQTPGAENSAPRIGPVMINEIMYKTSGDNVEYVTLSNITAQAVALYDTEYPTNSWSLSGAIDFVFPSGATLNAGESMLVCAEIPATFLATYTNVPGDVQVFGPFVGNLDNRGERLKLNYPGNPEPTHVPQILIESVNYKPAAPWPVLTAPGSLIVRTSGTNPANDPVSWSFSTNGYTAEDLVPVSIASNWTGFSVQYELSGVKTNDADFDGLNDWGEYAFGGDPNSPGDTGDKPVLNPADGNYLFSFRNDTSLVAYVVSTDDLLDSDWTTNEVIASPSSDGLMGTHISSIITTQQQQFVRVIIAESTGSGGGDPGGGDPGGGDPGGGSPDIGILIGGTKGNGNFEAAEPASGSLNFANTENWYNASGDETATFTHDNGTVGSPEPNSRAAVPSSNIAVNPTGFEITEAGQTFDVSLALHRYGGGYNGDEVLRAFLFTAIVEVNEDLTTAEMTELGYTNFTVHGSWVRESATSFYVTTVADIGKTVYFGMELQNPTGSVTPRLDTLELEVLAPE